MSTLNKRQEFYDAALEMCNDLEDMADVLQPSYMYKLKGGHYTMSQTLLGEKGFEILSCAAEIAKNNYARTP